MREVAKLLNLDDSKMTYEREVECYQCGAVVPISQATITTIEVESGRRSASATLHGWNTNYSGKWRNGTSRHSNRRTKGLSYNLGATYYKQQKVAICADCVEANYSAFLVRRGRRRFFWLMVVLLVSSFVVYNKYGPYIGFFWEHPEYIMEEFSQ
jgi:hypothetical protein